MNMTTLAIINTNTNICENVTNDPRPANKIQLPGPYIAIDLDVTPAVDWVWDGTRNEYVSVEGIGNGGIGDNWDGQKLIQPHPNSN